AVKLNGKWGFISKNGKTAIQPNYDEVQDFSEGLAAVGLNGKFGYIDTNGKVVIPLVYDYDAAHYFHIEDYVRSFSEGFAGIKIENKWEFIDTKGKALGESFVSIKDFHEGLAAVASNGGKWGFIDREGKMTINPVYDKVGDFKNRLAPVYKLVYAGPPANDYAFLGYINKNGTEYWEDPAIWPMSGYNAQHTGQCPYDTSKNNGTIKWKFETGSQIMSSPAIALDGIVYIASTDNYLYALKPDGTPKWKYQVNSYLSSPAIGSDGTIYIGSTNTGDVNYLFAINPDGTLKWKYQGNDNFSSPVIALDGTTYVGSEDGYLYALNPDGTLKWNFKAEGDLSGVNNGISGVATAPNGTVYINSSFHFLRALNPDGSLKWSYKTGGPIYSAPVVGDDGMIYISSGDYASSIYVGPSYYYLYALNPNGTLKWKYQTGSYIYSSPAIASDGT
ncbi:MAG: PQQ-binding-like beta-propeller repeat protein, partial [Candidatus Kryptoniota bacterium]